MLFLNTVSSTTQLNTTSPLKGDTPNENQYAGATLKKGIRRSFLDVIRSVMEKFRNLFEKKSSDTTTGATIGSITVGNVLENVYAMTGEWKEPPEPGENTLAALQQYKSELKKKYTLNIIPEKKQYHVPDGNPFKIRKWKPFEFKP